MTIDYPLFDLMPNAQVIAAEDDDDDDVNYSVPLVEHCLGAHYCCPPCILYQFTLGNSNTLIVLVSLSVTFNIVGHKSIKVR